MTTYVDLPRKQTNFYFSATSTRLPRRDVSAPGGPARAARLAGRLRGAARRRREQGAAARARRALGAQTQGEERGGGRRRSARGRRRAPEAPRAGERPQRDVDRDAGASPRERTRRVPRREGRAGQHRGGEQEAAEDDRGVRGAGRAAPRRPSQGRRDLGSAQVRGRVGRGGVTSLGGGARRSRGREAFHREATQGGRDDLQHDGGETGTPPGPDDRDALEGLEDGVRGLELRARRREDRQGAQAAVERARLADRALEGDDQGAEATGLGLVEGAGADRDDARGDRARGGVARRAGLVPRGPEATQQGRRAATALAALGDLQVEVEPDRARATRRVAQQRAAGAAPSDRLDCAAPRERALARQAAAALDRGARRAAKSQRARGRAAARAHLGDEGRVRRLRRQGRGRTAHDRRQRAIDGGDRRRHEASQRRAVPARARARRAARSRQEPLDRREERVEQLHAAQQADPGRDEEPRQGQGGRLQHGVPHRRDREEAESHRGRVEARGRALGRARASRRRARALAARAQGRAARAPAAGRSAAGRDAQAREHDLRRSGGVRGAARQVREPPADPRQRPEAAGGGEALAAGAPGRGEHGRAAPEADRARATQGGTGHLHAREAAHQARSGDEGAQVGRRVERDLGAAQEASARGGQEPAALGSGAASPQDRADHEEVPPDVDAARQGRRRRAAVRVALPHPERAGEVLPAAEGRRARHEDQDRRGGDRRHGEHAPGAQRDERQVQEQPRRRQGGRRGGRRDGATRGTARAGATRAEGEASRPRRRREGLPRSDGGAGGRARRGRTAPGARRRAQARARLGEDAGGGQGREAHPHRSQPQEDDGEGRRQERVAVREGPRDQADQGLEREDPRLAEGGPRRRRRDVAEGAAVLRRVRRLAAGDEVHGSQQQLVDAVDDELRFAKRRRCAAAAARQHRLPHAGVRVIVTFLYLY